jgi:ribosome maturation factor RimP
MLDVADQFKGRYTLEVSSPGIDRPLFEIAHYRQQIGKKVKIKLILPQDGRKQYKGILQRVEGEDIYIQVENTNEELKLSLNNVEKGHLISEF